MNLIGDAADAVRVGASAMAAQFPDDVVAVERAIVTSEAGQRLGQNVVVVHVFQARFPASDGPSAFAPVKGFRWVEAWTSWS